MKFGNDNNKKINSELIYNKKYLKAEKKSYNEKINTCIYISVILIDSDYIKDKDYYPRMFLEKYKHVFRKKEVIIYY